MSGTIYPLTQYAFMAWCSVTAQGQILPITLGKTLLNVYRFLLLRKENFVFVVQEPVYFYTSVLFTKNKCICHIIRKETSFACMSEEVLELPGR